MRRRAVCALTLTLSHARERVFYYRFAI